MVEHAALSVRALSKRYELYARPVDRLLQTLWRGRRRFYREFWALRDVGFSLAPGQVLGVVGRNGSGKSTLLQVVAGTLAPTSGEVTTHGTVAALLELGSGFNPEFTGRENVFLNGAILGLAHDRVRELLPSILAFADIGEFIDRPVKTYSSGMALRLAFAVATAAAPQVLIVDEALAVGDEAFQRKCFARIEAIRDGGAVVLFVSHSPQQIVELCDTALLLEHGSVLMHDEPRRVVAEYQRLLYGPAGGAAPAAPPEEGHDTAAFDAELCSASTVAYGTHGARIGELSLRTPGGRDVNVLARGEVYVVSYETAFEVDADRVTFGMMIKTTTGVELGGGKYPRAGATGRVAAGSRLRVRFAFRCSLFPGTYFLNAGLTGEVGGTQTYLHRLVDALAFRVLPDPAVAPSAYVDFDVESSCEAAS